MKVLIIWMVLSIFIFRCQNEHLENTPARVETAAENVDLEVGSIITVTGRLISTICFSDENPDKHNDSLECATENTRQGIPVAVLEAGKSPQDAWILLTVPQIFEGYMGQAVRVTGSITSQGVLNPTRVEWRKEDGWVFIM